MTFSEQFPIVLQALNAGFLQTLKLFAVTLIGAIPLGLIISFGSMSRFRPLRYLVRLVIWVIRGTPLMLQLLILFFFPGLVLGKISGAAARRGAFSPPPSRSCLTTPAISPKFTAAAFRACPRGSRRLGRCSA